MNERIKELSRLAQIFANANCDDEFGSVDESKQRNSFQEKFAELIIGHATECVRDVLRDENSDLSYEAASQVQNRIKQFFGVEE